jgi:DNA repair protein RecN (Recombination protein N)
MRELGMGGGDFRVALESATEPDPAASGDDTVEFLVAINAGVAASPLRKTASGGELSRIALAIEVAALDSDAVPTMVFDEVDAGIGGAVAEIVGRKLRLLGEHRQVLTVTHLPQVAALAHQHVAVRKSVADGHTRTGFLPLSARERTEEVARMLGGIEITAQTRAHAAEMLKRAG